MEERDVGGWLCVITSLTGVDITCAGGIIMVEVHTFEGCKVGLKLFGGRALEEEAGTTTERGLGWGGGGI